MECPAVLGDVVDKFLSEAFGGEARFGFAKYRDKYGDGQTSERETLRRVWNAEQEEPVPKVDAVEALRAVLAVNRLVRAWSLKLCKLLEDTRGAKGGWDTYPRHRRVCNSFPGDFVTRQDQRCVC